MRSVARIIGWSIDTVANSNLVVNALDMAIKNRNPSPGWVVHGRSWRAIHIVGIYQRQSGKQDSRLHLAQWEMDSIMQ
jgi:hypothetical protein